MILVLAHIIPGQFEIGRILRMAMAQPLHVPPRALFGHILGAVIGNIVRLFTG